jgi:CubicO group peptidase (beta-lactamase class C family)
MRNKIEKLFSFLMILVLITGFSIKIFSMGGISTNSDDFSNSVSTSSTQDIYWPGNSSEWTEVAPETQGLNSSKIAEMFELIEDDSYSVNSIIVVRNGYLLVYEYLQHSEIFTNINGSKSYPWGTLHGQWSTTKSLMSILIGIAIQEGFLDNISQTLYEFFAHIWDANFTDSELKKDITIEQLLTMNSGLVGYGPLYPPENSSGIQADCIIWTLDKIPLVFTPGQVGAYEYSSDGPNLLSGIITNVTGRSAEEFAKEYLFEPLGISEDEYHWWHDDKNVSYGGYLFDCSPKVQAKLGILCLNNGTWNGEQIVDRDYMKDAISPQITNLDGPYGYLFYLDIKVTITDWFGVKTIKSIDGYYTVGMGGQCIYVLPEYNIVAGFTADDVGHWIYNQILENYILQFVEVPETGPNNPGIPGFNLNMIILMIFYTSVVIIIRSKKSSTK